MLWWGAGGKSHFITYHRKEGKRKKKRDWGGVGLLSRRSWFGITFWEGWDKGNKNGAETRKIGI